MKFLHLADLHLGKQLCDVSLMEDQEAVLDRIVGIARSERTDGVLIAGDVYQRASPQAEAMALFDRFVTQLTDLGQKIFIISGNHDAPERISYFSALLKNAGVYVSEAFDGKLQRVALEDEYGPLNLWLMPFLRPSRVRQWFPGHRIETYEDAVRTVIGQAQPDPGERNILLCHQFITGCETSESEERAVGGLDNIDASAFDLFDYVALGHIHKPQRIGRDTLRYAGSPLKYSASEARHRKSVTVVEAREKGNVAVRTVPLQPLRDVRLAEGTMRELMEMPYSEDYIFATIRDEIVPPDARVTLSVNFPNLLKTTVVNSRTKQDLDVLAVEKIGTKTITQLFSDFYRLQNNGQAPGEEHLKVLSRVYERLEEMPSETRQT